MSKVDFGRIVSSLRKELRNEFDETMTQNDLADLARIPLITLQKIEQGKQANLKPELILRLANALNLSSYSRQVFFQASLGMSEKELINSTVGTGVIIEDIKSILVQLQTPAFITNCFGDLFLVNPSFLSIFGITENDLSHGHLLCKYNINRIFYSPEFEALQKMFGDSYAAFARRRVFIFKALTLKYRNHWYLLKILPELNRYPRFRQYWQSSTFNNEEIFILSNRFSLAHPKLGLLNFVSFPIRTISEETDLYLFSYQPLDPRTSQVCSQLANELGTAPVQFNNWIIPPKPGFLESSA